MADKDIDPEMLLREFFKLVLGEHKPSWKEQMVYDLKLEMELSKYADFDRTVQREYWSRRKEAQRKKTLGKSRLHVKAEEDEKAQLMVGKAKFEEKEKIGKAQPEEREVEIAKFQAEREEAFLPQLFSVQSEKEGKVKEKTRFEERDQKDDQSKGQRMKEKAQFEEKGVEISLSRLFAMPKKKAQSKEIDVEVFLSRLFAEPKKTAKPEEKGVEFLSRLFAEPKRKSQSKEKDEAFLSRLFAEPKEKPRCDDGNGVEAFLSRLFSEPKEKSQSEGNGVEVFLSRLFVESEEYREEGKVQLEIQIQPKEKWEDEIKTEGKDDEKGNSA